jgi:hypothetical protein
MPAPALGISSRRVRENPETTPPRPGQAGEPPRRIARPTLGRREADVLVPGLLSGLHATRSDLVTTIRERRADSPARWHGRPDRVPSGERYSRGGAAGSACSAARDSSRRWLEAMARGDPSGRHLPPARGYSMGTARARDRTGRRRPTRAASVCRPARVTASPGSRDVLLRALLHLLVTGAPRARRPRPRWRASPAPCSCLWPGPPPAAARHRLDRGDAGHPAP